MKTYFMHDGHNELGPFSIEDLAQIKLTRNTPIREESSDKWRPAEKVDELKEKVVPRKIRINKDFVPAVIENVSDLRRRKPMTLYGSLLLIALLTCISIYSINANAKRIEVAEAPVTIEEVKPKVLSVKQELPIVPEEKVEVVKKKVEVAKPAVVKMKPVKVEPDKAQLARKNWRKLITATNSNYGIGVLGGIRGLKVIITNNSDFPVDEAIVKVSYVKGSGKDIKSTFLSIYNIGANDVKEVEVEDETRGKKVSVAIVKLVSKKMMFRYSVELMIRNPQDPYFTGPSNM